MLGRQKRNFKFLTIGILGFVGLTFFAHEFAPSTLPIIFIFFSLFFLSGYFILQYLLNNVRRSILVSLGLTILLILRAVGLREPIYPTLLIASLLSLEFLFSKTK